MRSSENCVGLKSRALLLHSFYRELLLEIVNWIVKKKKKTQHVSKKTTNSQMPDLFEEYILIIQLSMPVTDYLAQV